MKHNKTNIMPSEVITGKIKSEDSYICGYCSKECILKESSSIMLRFRRKRIDTGYYNLWHLGVILCKKCNKIKDIEEKVSKKIRKDSDKNIIDEESKKLFGDNKTEIDDFVCE